MFQKAKNIYHLGNAFLANTWYGFPSRKFTVIGVTGTDGKTTTVNIIYHILKSAGLNVSMISSIGAIINNEKYDVGFHVTTPSPWMIQRFIKKATEQKVGRLTHVSNDAQTVLEKNQSLSPSSLNECRSTNIKLGLNNKLRSTFSSFENDQSTNLLSNYLVLEVTSHALDQFRVWGINFEIGVLTNVTNEHLDYHKTYENYVRTKAKLLQNAKYKVVNMDDKSYKLISNFKFQISNAKWITYGMSKNSDINPESFPFETKIIGEFNKYNIMAAIGACRALGISDGVIRKAVVSFDAPIGREEIVYDKDFTVMVDFAHTPNALEQILSSIKPKVKGRLIHVFGSAGERDYKKRPEMGKISAKYADVIILTAEDPRSESVKKIMKEIDSGIKNYELRIKNKTLFKIADRQQAIDAVIKMAKKGDFVLLTGKGHEKSMNYGQGEVSWSEHKTVGEAINRFKK